MINKTKWRDEQQFSKRVIFHLNSLGYMVNRIEPNAAAGATVGMPDLMVVSSLGNIKFIELKCIQRPKDEKEKFYKIKTDVRTRFSLKDSQLLKFFEFKKRMVPIWVLVAEKGTPIMAVTTYESIEDAKIATNIFVQRSNDFKKVFQIMGFNQLDVVDTWNTGF